MRAYAPLLLALCVSLWPVVCGAQGQATIPDALLSDEPGKPSAKPQQAPRVPAEPAAPAQAPAKKTEQKPSGQQAAPGKKRAGVPHYLDMSKYVTVFEDSFADNRNNWVGSNTPEALIEVRGGALVFEHRRKTGAWMYHRLMGLDLGSNFLYEVEYSIARGSQDGFFGLIFGAGKTGEDARYQRFILNFAGQFSYSEVVQRASPQAATSTVLLPKAPAGNYRPGYDKLNKLTLIRYRDKLHLFVNNEEVGELAYSPPGGVRMGFSVGHESTVRVHRVTLKAFKD